ncbi:MAG: hypothetical protein HRU32_07935, partial [Rhodobacteraceae bacterium]|nr:hypothetical protein [Paracoccaceae bacterium]
MKNAPPNRRAIVHIGLNKTGSTTLQFWLANNADKLREHGVWFDDLRPHGGPELSTAVGWKTFACTALPKYKVDQWERQVYDMDTKEKTAERVATFLDRVEATLPPEGETYVTSAEHIGTGVRPPQSIRLLHSWFAERFTEVKYVVYIRDQVDWIPSAYVQAIRSGATLSIEDFIEAKGANNFFYLVNNWREETGADSVIVRRLDRKVLVDGDLVADFASIIGVNPNDFAPRQPANESMSAFQTTLTRYFSICFGWAVKRFNLLPWQRRIYDRNWNLPARFKKPKLNDRQA